MKKYKKHIKDKEPSFFEKLGPFYKEYIQDVLAIISKITIHIWVPTTVGIISFILFGCIDQTKEIYRALISDQNYLQAFWSTFNIFWLSLFIFLSGRLLSNKYEGKQNSTKLSFEKWYKDNSKNSLNGILEELSKLLFIFFVDSRFLFFKKLVNLGINTEREKANNFLEHFYLLILPRLVAFLPFGGLFWGIFQSGAIKNDFFTLLWLALCAVGALFLLYIILRRRKLLEGTKTFLRTKKILSENSVKLLEKIKILRYKSENISEVSVEKSSTSNDGLFSDTFENCVVNLSLLWFSALTIPVVNKISGSTSIGVLAVFLFCIVINSFLFKWNPIKKGDSPTQKILSPIPLMILNVIASLIFLKFPPLFWADCWGAISLAALSLSAITVVFSTIYYRGYSWGLPAVSALLFAAFILSYFNFNDNHQIRYLNRNYNLTNSPSSPSIESNFEDWFSNRTDLDTFKKQGIKEYPVYVVSAQGGGIYAAYHAATTLAKLHDTIPNFSEHVFAISGVSGGSIGSSIYSSLVKVTSDEQSKENIQSSANLDCQQLPLCSKVHKVLNRDFLSPLLSFGLFPDLLQRLIPLPISINDWDRARGLELALEDSWKEKLKPEITTNPLEKPYSEFWQSKEKAPALVLNTTIVETGERFVFSPFTIPSSTSKTIVDEDLKIKNSDLIPLSTAATLSARFPIVTPAGWVNYSHRNQPHRMRLVDGGYYDNSGLVTARDIVNALSDKRNNDLSVVDKLLKTYEIKPKLINLAIVDSPQTENFATGEDQGLNEILSPVKAVLNVRNTRANSVLGQAAYDLNRDSAGNPQNTRFRAFFLDKEKTNLPLGWLLSKKSQDTINNQSPSYQECKAEDKVIQFVSELTNKINVNENNSCVAKLIFKELNIENRL